jgi:hypothetical protein
MLNVRKLAAIDLQFLGPRLVLTEFCLGVSGSMVLGFLTLRAGHRSHSARMITLGGYLLMLGINYVPLLLHAIDMTWHRAVGREIAGELGDKRAAFRKYRRQSLLLLLPLVVPTAAIVEEVRRRRTRRFAPGADFS